MRVPFKMRLNRGVTALSYGLLVGLIAVVALLSVTSSGDSVNALMTKVSDTIDSTPSPTPTPLPDAPTVTLTSPSSVSANFGDQVILTATATGDQISLQWHLDGVPVSGATADTLTLSSLTQNQLGSYELVVTNPGGSATSAAATVSASLQYTGQAFYNVDPGPTNTCNGALNASGWFPSTATSFNGSAGVDGNPSTSVTVNSASSFHFCTCYFTSFPPVRVASINVDVRMGPSTGGRQVRLRRADGVTQFVTSGGVLSNTNNINQTVTSPNTTSDMVGAVFCYNGQASSSSNRSLTVDEFTVNLAP
ncbi:MAG: hypothetical protein Alpg2KO_16430 [Alphaproteobacteria bacterium]